jgi:hypothetical protein
VAVHDIGRRLNRPEWIVRVTTEVFQNCATGVFTLPFGFEMPIGAKLFVKFLEVLSLFVATDQARSPYTVPNRPFLCSSTYAL